MIVLTWGNLRDRDFMTALGKIYGQPMEFHIAQSLAVLGREIKQQQKLCDEKHLSILKKYGKEDKESNRPGTYNIAEATKLEYAEEMTKLDAHSFRSRIDRLDGAKLGETIKFTPQDLMILEPVFAQTNLDVEDKETNLKVAPTTAAEMSAH